MRAHTLSLTHTHVYALVDRYKGRKNLLVGHSYGCSQAARLAASRAEQVHGLVMIGPGYAPSHFPAGSIKVFKAPLIVLKMMRPLLSRGFAERAFHPLTRQASCQAHRRLLRRAQVFSGTNSMHVCQAFYQQMLWVDEELLHHIPCAVLVIVGEGDKITPVKYAQAVHQVLRGNPRRLVEYSEVKEASHQVMQEKPLHVSHLILVTISLPSSLSRSISPPPRLFPRSLCVCTATCVNVCACIHTHARAHV